MVSASDTAALVSTLKAVVGTGVITLPYATKKVGWVLSIGAMAVIATLSAYTMVLLVKSMRIVRLHKLKEATETSGPAEKSPQSSLERSEDPTTTSSTVSERESNSHEPDEPSEVTLADMGHVAFGPWARYTADFVMITAQVSSGMAYIAFISANLAALLSLTEASAAIVVFPFLLFQTILKSTRYLAPFAMVGNLLFVSAFSMAMYFGATERTIDTAALATVRWDGVFTFFGLALFAFTAHAEILSIWQHLSLETEQHYDRIVVTAVTTALLVFVAFGVGGYAFFGDDTQDNIFMNLACPPCNGNADTGNLIGKIVKGFTATMVVFNFPFSMWPGAQQIEDLLLILYRAMTSSVAPSALRDEADTKPLLPSGRGALRWLLRWFVSPLRILNRVVLCVVVAVVAVKVPDFGYLSAVAGCLHGFLAFVLPPLFYLRLDWQRLTETPSMAKQAFIVANVLLIVVGTAFSFLSTALVVAD